MNDDDDDDDDEDDDEDEEEDQTQLLVHSTSKYEVTHHVAIRTNADGQRRWGLRAQRR